LATEQPIHFGEGKAKLFPFSENVFMPGKPSKEWKKRGTVISGGWETNWTDLHNCATLFLQAINTGTWSSRLEESQK
jgi:hypothetical protein